MQFPKGFEDLDVFSLQFAFLSLQLLKSRKRPSKDRKPPPITTSRPPSTPTPTHTGPPLPSHERRDVPLELLQTIFLNAVTPSQPNFDVEEGRRIEKVITSISQVCKRWRYAAFGHSELWTNSINFQNHNLETIIHRLRLSNPHPIAVGHRQNPLCIRNERDVTALNTLRTFHHRIREFNVDVSSTHLTIDLNWLNSSRGPFFDALRLNGDHVGPCGASFSLQDPSPSKLSLHDTNLGLLSSTSLSSLTELSVSGIATTNPLTAGQWVDRLRDMPQLRLLSIHDSIQDGPSAPPYVPPLSLPHLRLLSFGDSSPASARALFRFFHSTVTAIPPSCGIELGLPPQAGSNFARTVWMDRLARSVRRHLRRPSSVDAPSLGTFQLELGIRAEASRYKATLGTVADPETALDWNGPLGTDGVMTRLEEFNPSLRSAPAHPTTHPSPRNSIPIISVGIRNPGDSGEFSDAMMVIQDSARDARSLRIVVESPALQGQRDAQLFPSLFCKSIPRKLLSKMDATTNLVLNEPAVTSVLPFLCLKGTASSGAPLETPILPNLKYVVLEKRGGESPASSGRKTLGTGSEEVNDLAWQTLNEFVRWRKVMGRPADICLSDL